MLVGGCYFSANGESGEKYRVSISRSSVGAWRLQTCAEHDSDDMGAAQVLAQDLGEAIPDEKIPFDCESDENRLTAVFEDSRIEINYSPFSLKLYSKQQMIAECTSIGMADGGAQLTGNLCDGEALFGTGERFNHANQRGKLIEVMSIDRWCQTEGNSYCPVPFVLSSRGYALFLNRYERSALDLGATNPSEWRFNQSDAPLDLYIFSSENPAEMLAAYSRLTGFSPMPAEWLFGIQVTRHARLREFGTIEGIEAMIKAMEENDFPWDAVIAEGWRAYETDTYKDLKTIADRVHAMGKKILLYEGCARVPYSEDDDKQQKLVETLEFKAEYLVREPDGNFRLPETATYNPADAPNPRRSQFIDITNPATMEWWYELIWGRLVRDIGIDGCKIDFCEQVPDHIPLVFHDGRSEKGAHHWYPTLYNALMYRFYQKHRPEGGMCYSRGGGIGAQRYPFLWAGDQLREFKFLQAILTSILSSGLSGMPFMSYDMSGYMPARIADENPEDRVFIRGAQMSCFSSNMQTHGIVTRPYDFDEPTKDIYRIYAKLHQKLRPYLVEQAKYSCETGTPLLRHLFLYDPTDTSVYTIEDEYMLGDALLVAPVFTNDEQRDIYLPIGEWKNLLTGQVYSGKQLLKDFPVPLNQIPVFLRVGHASATVDAALKDAQDLLNAVR